MRLAIFQPRIADGAPEADNLPVALEMMARAKGDGADLLLFPEGYPGPASPKSSYDCLPPLQDAAAKHGIHLVGSRIVAAGADHAMELFLIDDRGAVAGRYHRTTPRGPYIYKDIDAWGFDYAEADMPPVVVETRLGRIGMLVCSELFVPELSRLLALQGADLILYPAGGAINELLPAWRNLVWARATENVVFTAAVQNLYGAEEGVATIASPEKILAQSAGEGLLIADLDMQRLAFLRSEDERIEFPKRYASIPGLMRWRRPELYAALAERGPGDERG